MTAITGIVLGSSVSISVSLFAVLLIFLILGDDYPRLGYEFRGLVNSFMIFLGMTAISALSFYTLLKRPRYQYPAQVAMWLGIFSVGWFYWPESA
ncbi:MAG: hypothetical protein HKN35_08190 [Woeseia sp.]|nr:hypothetical protein [Woeseia sp.]